MHQPDTKKSEFKTLSFEGIGAGVATVLAIATFSLSGCKTKAIKENEQSAAAIDNQMHTEVGNPSAKPEKIATANINEKERVQKDLEKVYKSIADLIVFDISADRQKFVDYYSELNTKDREKFIRSLTEANLNKDSSQIFTSPDTGLKALMILCSISKDISDATRQMFIEGRLDTFDKYLNQASQLDFYKESIPLTRDASARAEAVLRLADLLNLKELPSVKQAADVIWQNLEKAKGQVAENGFGYSGLRASYSQGLESVLYYNFNM